MRKLDFCISKNKDADQLHGIILLLPRSEIHTIFCGYTAWFVSDLIVNPDDRFSHEMDYNYGMKYIFSWPVSYLICLIGATSLNVTVELVCMA